MRAFTIASVAAALVASVSAHMEMTSPPPLRSKANKNAGQNIDYSMTSPLEADGSNFPCKGYLDDTEGKESVATWQAGSSQQITITGGANHGGGSCQLSISEDEGKTFKVIKSFEGACPANTGDNTLNVDIPTDVKNGDVVFAWTWNNEIGNREFYMNCAMVTIENGGSGLDSYPDMFVAQLSSINSCTIAEGIDVKYPNPGDQVEVADDDSKLGDPTGDCGATGSSSGGSSGGSSGASGSSSAGGAGATGASSAGGAGASASVSIGIGGGSGSAPTSAAGASSAAASATGVNNGGDGGVGDLSSALGGASSAAGGAGASATSAASGSSATGAAGSSGSAGGASGASGVAGSSATGAASATGSASGAAGSAVPCDNEGETRCDSTTTWSVCGSGIWQNMGSTAAGMKCVNGSMELDSDSAASSSPAASARALREARSFVSHKRHWKSRRHA